MDVHIWIFELCVSLVGMYFGPHNLILDHITSFCFGLKVYTKLHTCGFWVLASVVASVHRFFTRIVSRFTVIAASSKGKVCETHGIGV